MGLYLGDNVPSNERTEALDIISLDPEIYPSYLETYVQPPFPSYGVKLVSSLSCSSKQSLMTFPIFDDIFCSSFKMIIMAW